MGRPAGAPTRRAPLAAWARRFEGASLPGVVELTALPFLAQLDLRLDACDEQARALVDDALGIELPRDPNRVSDESDRAALWLGPDEWLLVGEPGSEREIGEHVRQALAGRHHSIVDVTANRVALELAGERARELLATGCALDLHPRAFGPGQCAQTLFSRAQVVLWQTDDTPTFRLFVRPSFAPYLAAWLLDAMVEFDPGDG